MTNIPNTHMTKLSVFRSYNDCSVANYLHRPANLVLLGILTLMLNVPSIVRAQEYEPVTALNVEIEVESLKLKVIPLEKSELLVETEAWQELLKAKATEIVDLEIQERSAEGTDKASISQSIQDLIRERTLLADRMIVVMNAYAAKGGEVADYKNYIRSVTGISFDIKDVGKTSSRALFWLKSEEGGMRWAGNLVSFFLILVAFWFLSLVMGNISRKTMNRLASRSSELLKDFFGGAVRKLVFLIGIIVALDVIGIESGPFLATFGAVGFILGFALQGTLGNLAAGIMILLHRPYDIGNFVTAGGVTGKVTSMNLASTTFLTGDNQVVIVPNGTIWGDVITNVTGSETRRVDMVFGIGYGDGMDRAEALLAEITSQHPKVLKDPSPTIKTNELADSSVNIICRPWAKTSDYWEVYWDITKQVKKRFDAEGISIPYPQRDIHLHQQ